MDGTLIEAWASQRSIQPTDDPSREWRHFRRQQRSRQTHQWQQEHPGKLTLAAYHSYDRQDLTETLRHMGVLMHAAQKRKGSPLDWRTARNASYD